MDINSQTAFVALGSNLAAGQTTPAEMLKNALQLMEDYHDSPIEVSDFVSSPAFPPNSGPDFVNAVASLRTDWPAERLLELLHQIEAELGRTRPARWAPRVVDLDLLAVGKLVLPDAATHDQWRALAPDRQRSEAPDRLILPHPRLQDRAFVLVPWAQIAPDWRHPRTGMTVARMRDALPAADRDAVRPFDGGGI
ncbi:2-amino-4-hydroxy-6-hydroxymethyldihydropteridinediphosphokinase [Palleronia salina]|uniref:2-amino-4-hydroxy-6-hydroxymethyldihydropteridine pyrophosphokinase n=2 Tax=Palleronia salina TaxID=313368 RepID=A0A1M6GWU1_9RHOB|nr:2-amino-4-hydroxy-6-hydroxymethyldihydropteridinediphosphokinase [Palleronia salina]